MIKLIMPGDPGHARSYKSRIEYHARQMQQGEPIAEAIAVEIEIFRSPPKSISSVKKNAEAIKREKMQPISKPYIDSYAKAVIEGCSGIVWLDDSLIVELHIRKYYSDNPRTILRVCFANKDHELQALEQELIAEGLILDTP